MKAMILAAGRGQRMRPLTDHTPKPLLKVGGKPLIVWHIEKLVAAGLRDIVINCAWLGQRLQAALGNGESYGARLIWSPEDPALETAGGIAHALPHLGSDPFLVVNGDIWCDWDFRQASERAAQVSNAQALAWLLLVDNPPHHTQGDFCLNAAGYIQRRSATHDSLTFSGIGVYQPRFFATISGQEPAPLAPLLHEAVQTQSLIGSRHTGQWLDIGTPERLQHLDTQLTS
ncbi:MAG: nucleotidyltransferase family protein [Alcaligenaceae bacterium]|nr:nucleotidyltransferase family protein [Alcaligenaceae bacterium]